MGGKDHPERAARRGERHLLRELPVGQQPHEQLVGPGYPQGWGRPWRPGHGVLLLYGLRHLEGAERSVTGPRRPGPAGAGGRPTWLTHSTGLRKVQLSRRSSAPSASRRWALRARAALSNSERKGAATESMTTRRAMPRASSTGTFSLTHCSRVS